eukprot:6489748-Prymnesium_polylepis.1
MGLVLVEADRGAAKRVLARHCGGPATPLREAGRTWRRRPWLVERIALCDDACVAEREMRGVIETRRGDADGAREKRRRVGE